MVDVVKANPASVRRASALVRKGGLVAFPTDTVYGLGCDPRNEQAVRRLILAKARSNRPIPVICSTLGVAEGLVVLSPTAMRLAEEYWPGALTIVAPQRAEMPSLVSQGTAMVGVRVPASPLCVSLARGVGGAITGTSANLSGQPSCRTAEEVVKSLDGRVDLVIDGGALQGLESTVVKVVGETVEVLRRGSIGVDGALAAEPHPDVAEGKRGEGLRGVQGDRLAAGSPQGPHRKIGVRRRP
jgi:L-threonylcarbamoyladenylate synthase